MFTVKCERFDLKEDFKNFLRESDEFRLNNVQTYYPIMGKFMKYYNNSLVHENFVLNSQFRLIDFASTEGLEISCDKGTENYKCYIANIKDTLKNINFQKQIFIKQSPVLNPISQMMNQYPSNSHNMSLPYSSFFWNNYFKKINNVNNSTYIDSFFTFLGSQLVEKELCPNFPIYYGSYCGVVEEFEYDITEEYSEFKDKHWFIKGQNKNIDGTTLFELRRSDNDSEIDSENYINNMENINEIKLDKNKLKSFDQTIINNLEIQSEIDHNESESNEEIINDNVSNDFEFLNQLSEIDKDHIKDIDELDDSIDSDDGSIKLDILNETYAILRDFPVQIICMEKCKDTLESILEKSKEDFKKINKNNEEEVKIFYQNRDDEWKSYLFQICFALAISQKKYEFVHNDLHSSNIMYVETNDKFIYYRINSNYYRIPTYGKILKIIDFGRATFNFNGEVFFSDVFKINGDAGGQYTYPFEKSKYNYKNKIIKPNPSFDLCRLSCSIIFDLFKYPPSNIENGKNLSTHQKETENDLFNLLYSWIVDKYKKEVTRYEDFDLYRIIARRMNNAIPEKQIQKPIFDLFKIQKNQIDISLGEIYKL